MNKLRDGFNLKIQRFSIEKYDLLLSFLGQLNGPETSIRVHLVSRAESNLDRNLKQVQNVVVVSVPTCNL